MFKRARDGDSEDVACLASYLMLLSGQGEETSRVFTCKTCNREFTSFQALGGHRASHKKPRLTAVVQPPSPHRPKTHECTICGQEFAIGQALGGHMRRHRDGAGGVVDRKLPLLTLSLATTGKVAPAVLKNANSRRVLCLDLNLPPVENGIVYFEKAW